MELLGQLYLLLLVQQEDMQERSGTDNASGLIRWEIHTFSSTEEYTGAGPATKTITVS
jgi:hypothetical protein